MFSFYLNSLETEQDKTIQQKSDLKMNIDFELMINITTVCTTFLKLKKEILFKVFFLDLFSF